MFKIKKNILKRGFRKIIVFFFLKRILNFFTGGLVTKRV